MSEEQVIPEEQAAPEAPEEKPAAVHEAPSAADLAAAALAGAWKGSGSAPAQDKPAQQQGGQPRPERQAKPGQGPRENRPPREGGNTAQSQGERTPGGR